MFTPDLRKGVSSQCRAMKPSSGHTCGDSGHDTLDLIQNTMDSSSHCQAPGSLLKGSGAPNLQCLLGEGPRASHGFPERLTTEQKSHGPTLFSTSHSLHDFRAPMTPRHIRSTWFCCPCAMIPTSALGRSW